MSLEEEEEVQGLLKSWDINDTRSQCVHKIIGDMLAVDCQLLSMVCFKCLASFGISLQMFKL